MLVTAAAEETYCLKTQEHVPARSGPHVVCYRCGILLGEAEEVELGSMLDY